MDSGLVVAFPESPALRETLAILLERDCRLRFLRPDVTLSADCRTASVALVATTRPERLVQGLWQQCPALPIVDVDVTGDRRTDEPNPPDGRLYRVPLEPHAIRGAVLQHLVPDPDASLRATARVIGETLRSDLAYACAALQSFSALHASSPGPDTYALLGAVMREQSYVLGETVEQLQHFRNRARTAVTSPEFAAVLCQQLQRQGPTAEERSLLCHCVVDAACRDLGPVELAPTVAGFLRVHLRRTADTAVIEVRQRREGIMLRYRRRTTSAKRGSWPLLLAALALEPSWGVATSIDDDHEVVRLQRRD